MAMGDKIKCPVGGVVETTLTLDFKKALVDQRPDQADFRVASFLMHELNQPRNAFSTPRKDRFDVTKDDQEITVRWEFINNPAKEGTKDPVFQVGREWELKMEYTTGEATAARAPERTFVLGTVTLTAN